MNMIVAVDKNWAIGKNNQLLVSIPADMNFFRSTTKGKIVVMGRKTLESFPGGRPLKDRVNIVLTSDASYDGGGAIVVHTMEELDEELKKYNSDDIYCIGGGTLYRQMLPKAEVCHVTKIDRAYDADTWFPNLDQDEEWAVVAESDEQTYYDNTYRFICYCRKDRIARFMK